MGFYCYFMLAKKYCPKELRGFQTPLAYEVARIMQAWEYDPSLEDHAFILWAIRSAYDNIVERMGEEIAASNIQTTEEYVSIRNRKAGRKADSGTTAPIS